MTANVARKKIKKEGEIKPKSWPNQRRNGPKTAQRKKIRWNQSGPERLTASERWDMEVRSKDRNGKEKNKGRNEAKSEMVRNPRCAPPLPVASELRGGGWGLGRRRRSAALRVQLE